MSQESFTSVSNERNCTSEHICSNNFHSVFLLYYYFDHACPHFKICEFKWWEHVANCHIDCYTGRIFYGSIYVGQVSAGIFLISEHCFFPCRGKWSSNIVCRTEYRNENIFSMYRQHSSGTDAGDGIGASYSRTFRDPALCGLFRIHGTWDPNRSCGFYKGRRVFSEKGRYHYFS